MARSEKHTGKPAGKAPFLEYVIPDLRYVFLPAYPRYAREMKKRCFWAWNVGGLFVTFNLLSGGGMIRNMSNSHFLNLPSFLLIVFCLSLSATVSEEIRTGRLWGAGNTDDGRAFKRLVVVNRLSMAAVVLSVFVLVGFVVR